MTAPDPRVRKDGLCANCKQPRKHAKWNRYSGHQPIGDPFCSSTCCRAWHDAPRDTDRVSITAGITYQSTAGAAA